MKDDAAAGGGGTAGAAGPTPGGVGGPPSLGGPPPNVRSRRGRRLKNLKLDRVDLVHAPANPDAKVKLFKGMLPSEVQEAELAKAGYDTRTINARVKVKDGKFHAMHEDGETILGSYDDRAKAVKRVADSLKKAAPTKTENGEDHPASDYAYVPDPKTPSTWKLLLDTPAHIGGAVAALGPGGYRGQKVQIPAGDLAAVKAKVKAAWLKAHPDQADSLPPVLKSYGTTGGVMKNLEVIKAKLAPEVVKHLEDLHETNPAAAEALADSLLAAQPAAPAAPAESVEKSEYAKLEKQLADEKAAREATETRIAKMEQEAARNGFVALAKADLETLGKAEDLGSILFEANSKLDEATYKSLEQVLKGAAAKLSDTALFKQLTNEGEPNEGVDAVAVLAKGLVDNGKYATIEAATVQVLTEHPELYRQYRDNR